jgi:AAA family ATP:ADP antiporter
MTGKMQAENSDRDIKAACNAKYVALRTVGIRSAFLFINFFLILLSYYQVKPASRSLFMEALGFERFPYVWIAVTITIGLFVTGYHLLVGRYSRIMIVQGTCLVFGASLVIFRFLFNHPHPVVPFCFYVFTEIFGLVLVEQFWSLTNSIYTVQEGKIWYGIVGIGGIIGAVFGGGMTAALVEYFGLKTMDLLLTAAGILVLIFVLTWVMGRVGIYCEVDDVLHLEPSAGGWRILRRSRYLILIAAILFLAQLASPFVEFQFMSQVQGAYPGLDPRTVFLAKFQSLLGVVAFIINMVLTPFVLRIFGTIGGLLVQPMMISICSWLFLQNSTLIIGGAAKISDRGLSYSINRASKELLYVPLRSVLIYQAKAWIDMFGYWLAKGSGSVVILLLTTGLPFTLGVPQLSWLILGICGCWIILVVMLRRHYRLASRQSV